MELIISSFILFWLAVKKPVLLWLALPLGLSWDFGQQELLGLTGLKILFWGGIFWLVFGQFFDRPGKLKF
ncbi:MAG TPA: hypothetical protein VMW04_00990 [Patescibacteria group bacterium]|nr:hypothetical protein [Patescibacteria group bacterium]